MGSVVELTIIAETVRTMLRMQPVRPGLVDDGQKVSVYKCDLDGKRRVISHLSSNLIVQDAGLVVHMEGDACKLFGQAIEDVKIAPNWLIIDRS